jgi:predicted O-linked N-acetylglucosamine transferase (SPINDLY family)
MKRYSAALESYDRAIALKPDYFEAYSNRGTVLIRLNQAAAALRSFDRAIAIKPDFLEAHHGRGIALSRLNRHEEAVASHSRALAIDPSNADASYSRGNALKELNRLPEAMSSYEQAAASEPDHPLALSAIAYLALCLCDWEVLGRVRQPLFESCMLPTFKGMCFPVLAMSDDLALQEATARHYVQNNLPQMSAKPPIQRHPGRRIRLGYLSADFGDHPTSYLLAELIELHDRDRFEVYGFSVGSDDRSQMRQRLRSAFDDFIDVRGMSDEALAAAIRNAEIDIIIDLGGHTHDGRILALAGRPAPVQVTYLGYPGTVGAPFIDYAIVDRHVVPVEAEQYFQEKLIRLPDAYQVNDRKRQIGELTLSRSDCGLPDDGFVFCCFNHVNKINPAVFDTWMRILQGTPRSVLWLLQDNEWASENLRNEAIRRGAPSQRLVFAPKIKLADHLSRLRLADLFLDTWPYNAHTTASDALWVGLPVLTLTGKSFASRVAGSLLHAVRMPEMVTQTSDEYVELAIRLGNSSAMARALSDKLKANIHTTALFNTPLTCRHIEAAFTRVWERYQRSESPQTVTLCN